MQPLLPPIGLKGTFTLQEPLSAILNPNITYKVFGIESIKKLVKDDIDVKTIIYINQGLTIEDYENDYINDIPIVTLITEAEQLFYIPSRYIVNMPEATGIIYKQRVILVNLGYVRDEMDVEFIAQEVADQVSAYTGLKCTSSVEDVSGDYLLSYEDADIKEKDRLKNVTNNITCTGRLAACQKTLEYYKTKAKLLIDKIK